MAYEIKSILYKYHTDYLMSLYPQDGGETYRMFRLFFHMPKGGSELELIR